MLSELQLRVVHQHTANTLADAYVTPHFKILTLPFIANDWHRQHQVLNLMQRSSSPGLLGGDCAQIDIQIETCAGLHMHTQSFTRVLSMNAGQFAQQNMNVYMADDARFCYVPLPLVLHAGADFRQHTRIDMGKRAELIFGEVLASGRTLNGEHFAFARLSSQIRVYHAEKLLLFDNLLLRPTLQNIQAMGQMETYSHQANWYYVHTHDDIQVRALYYTLSAVLSELNAQYGSEVLLGVTCSTPEIIVVRSLAHSSEVLQNLLALCTQQAMSFGSS